MPPASALAMRDVRMAVPAIARRHGCAGRRAVRIALTLACATSGGYLAEMAGLPAGWLSGSLLFVTAITLGGFSSEFPRTLSPVVYVIVGIYSGSGITGDILGQVHAIPFSIGLLLFSVVLVMLASYGILRKVYGWDAPTSLLASLPGALPFVMATAEGTGADLKKVAVSQTLRVLALVQIIPLATLLVDLPQAPRQVSASAATASQCLLLGCAAISAGVLLERLRLPGGLMLGALLASAALSVAGIVQIAPPDGLMIPAVIAMGAMTGSRLRPEDRRWLPAILKPVLVVLAVSIAISGLFAAGASAIFRVSFVQSLLAYSPGANDALIIVAYALNIDPLYVAAHHLARFLGITLVLPALARKAAPQPAGTETT